MNELDFKFELKTIKWVYDKLEPKTARNLHIALK